MTKVGIYCRVSTDKQSFDAQVHELTEYAHKRGWQIVGTFTDHASGRKESRPGLNSLMDLVKRRQIDVVLTWKLDRFGRSLKHLITTIADIEAVGAAFVSLRDNLDFTTPSGRFQFAVLAAVAEFEAGMIRERVRAGLARARAKGVPLGRRSQHDHSEILRLRSLGLSLRQIGESLKISKTHVGRVISKNKTNG